jgi:chromosome segregation ATPase
MMDIKAGEEHVRSEARDWRERALKAQAEIKRLRGEIIKLQFQGGTVDRQALENNVQRGKKIASLQADNELLSKLNQEYGAEIKRLRAVLEQIANLRPGYRFPDARDIAIEALKHE